MKVDVSSVRKAGKKISIPAACVRRRGYRVNIPVRVAVPEETETAQCGIIAEPSAKAEQVIETAAEAVSVAETDPVSELSAEEDDANKLPSDTKPEEDLPAEDPDEAELLALIAEEEAEMVSQLAQSGNADVYQGSFDADRIGSALDDVSAEDILEQADEAIAEADEDLAEAIESLAELDNEPAGAADELTPEEIALLESEAAGEVTDQRAAVEQYMRYFDRSTNGEKVEVSDSGATGQEIICVDGESGRLSRVCGFIKHTLPAQPVEEISPPEDSDGTASENE